MKTMSSPANPKQTCIMMATVLIFLFRVCGSNGKILNLVDERYHRMSRHLRFECLPLPPPPTLPYVLHCLHPPTLFALFEPTRRTDREARETVCRSSPNTYLPGTEAERHCL